MRKINGIFFDIGWTLEYPVSGDWNLTEHFYKEYPEVRRESFSAEVWDHAIDQAMAPVYQNHLLKTLDDEEDIFTQYFYILMNTLPGYSIDEAHARALAHERTYNNDKYLPLEGAIALLSQLKQQGYRLGLISDTFPCIDASLKQAGLYDFFSTRTYSYTFGKFKPDPIMYTDALKQMDLPGNETVFIDDLSKNLIGAEQYGIHGVQSLAKEGSVSDGNHPYVRKPLELLNILDQINQD
ncbi:MAG: HAD-IA family hydrolase [Solobacterium sp.]|jgi:HAD superfamily hydrolase (TIGR01509 family)|nr:HAD-IA family hydrolase [Solobacterium sp.]MCH4222116.1 HAD-IA family hydrolase [Solobacterium sp.]MCH4265897.1 HAD-IA family hydrolase [Solobacterium sp.]